MHSLRPQRRSLQLSLAIAATLGAVILGSRPVRAMECPTPGNAALLQPPVRASNVPEDEIHFQADSVDALRDGEMHLQGDVLIRQGSREIKTRDARYDPNRQSIRVQEGVEYSDPSMAVRGSGAQIDQQGGAVFDDAQFELHERNARGMAKRIRASLDGKLSLDGVSYTTCPPGNTDWELLADDIDINQASGIGIGRGVRVNFKGVPIFYTPIISFPVGDQRKSGFLFPEFGTSSRSGTSLSVPWYWNIAPNYDATFTPTYFAKRGAKLETEFRYMNSLGKGSVQAHYLPDDRAFGGDRSFVHFIDKSDFGDHLRLDIDAANAGDNRWFEDFGLGPEGTSVSYLNRSAALTYQNPNWLAVLRTQNYQTIDDDGIAPVDRPHTLLPQLSVQAAFPDQPFGLDLGLDMELGNFQHNIDGLNTGWRAELYPQVRMPLRGSGIYLEPAASWHYTAYELDSTSGLSERSPSRSLPIYSVDGGMVFERLFGARQQRLATLEPRFKYLYVPYRNQDTLPLYDTAPADLNLVQLFRTNRYSGIDRISDANQIAVGLTTRLLDADSGEQFLSATVGQAYYFDTPRIHLPGQVQEQANTSDIVAELDLRAYGNWNISAGIQWDPNATRSEKGDVQLQYRPAHDRVANVGYRFRRGSIEQIDGSVAWPIGERWSAYGRLVYSLEEETTLDQFAGLEYRSCCWRLRAVARRYVSDRTGDMDTSFLIQLEFNGLSSVGVGADAFLERSIRGYSSAAPQGARPRL